MNWTDMCEAAYINGYKDGVRNTKDTIKETLLKNFDEQKENFLRILGIQGAVQGAVQNVNRCVCCGDPIPEGIQVCPACENS